MDIWNDTLPDGRQAHIIVEGSNTENVWPSFTEWLNSHGIQPYIDHKGQIILAELPAEAEKEAASGEKTEVMVQMTQSSFRQMQEQIRNLKQLVNDYDTYLQEIMPHVYTYYSKPAQLRERARQEHIDIKEPTL